MKAVMIFSHSGCKGRIKIMSIIHFQVAIGQNVVFIPRPKHNRQEYSLIIPTQRTFSTYKTTLGLPGEERKEFEEVRTYIHAIETLQDTCFQKSRQINPFLSRHAPKGSLTAPIVQKIVSSLATNKKETRKSKAKLTSQ